MIIIPSSDKCPKCKEKLKRFRKNLRKDQLDFVITEVFYRHKCGKLLHATIRGK